MVSMRQRGPRLPKKPQVRRQNRRDPDEPRSTYQQSYWYVGYVPRRESRVVLHRPTSARRSEHPLDRSDPKRREFLLFLAAGLTGAAVGRGTVDLVDPTRAPLSTAAAAETAALREVLA